MGGISKTEQFLIVGFLALLVFPLLYLFRALDNNTLTSWQWVFESRGPLRTFGYVAGGVAAAYFSARTGIAERCPGLFLLVLSFAAIVPLWSEPEVILDTSRYFLQAKHLEWYGLRSFFQEWGRGISAWTDLPVVPFFYGLIFRYLGEVRLYIQIFTTLLFSLTVLLTCLIGRKLWNAETGLYAGLLLLGIPYLLTQVPLMLVDVPTMFFVTFAVYAFLNALEQGGPLRSAPSVLSLVLGLFSKYSVWLMLPVMPLMMLVYLKRDPKVTVIRSVTIIAAAGLPAAALLFSKRDVFWRQIGLLREYQLPGLSRWSESLASTYLFQVHPGIVVLALFAIFAGIKKKDVRFLIPGWFAVFGLQVERIRYILPLFPLLALAAAYGLQQFREKEVRSFIALCVVATSLALTLGAYLPFLRNTSMANLERAGRYLDALPGESVVIRVLPQRESSGNTETAIPILDLFTRKKLVYRRDHHFIPDSEQIRQSPLRFTWECQLPGFYSEEESPGRRPVALISSDSANRPPPVLCNNDKSLRSVQQFASDTGTFRFKTVVSVYSEQSLSETAQ